MGYIRTIVFCAGKWDIFAGDQAGMKAEDGGDFVIAPKAHLRKRDAYMHSYIFSCPRFRSSARPSGTVWVDLEWIELHDQLFTKQSCLGTSKYTHFCPQIDPRSPGNLFRYRICWSREYQIPTSEITKSDYDCKLRQTFAFGAPCRARLFLVTLINCSKCRIVECCRQVGNFRGSTKNYNSHRVVIQFLFGKPWIAILEHSNNIAKHFIDLCVHPFTLMYSFSNDGQRSAVVFKTNSRIC